MWVADIVGMPPWDVGRFNYSDPLEKLEEPDISGSSIPFLEMI
jgi:hypothetical protein